MKVPEAYECTYLYMELLRLLKAYFDSVLVFHLSHLTPPYGQKSSLIFWVNILIMYNIRVTLVKPTSQGIPFLW